MDTRTDRQSRAAAAKLKPQTTKRPCTNHVAGALYPLVLHQAGHAVGLYKRSMTCDTIKNCLLNTPSPAPRQKRWELCKQQTTAPLPASTHTNHTPAGEVFRTPKIWQRYFPQIPGMRRPESGRRGLNQLDRVGGRRHTRVTWHRFTPGCTLYACTATDF